MSLASTFVILSADLVTESLKTHKTFPKLDLSGSLTDNLSNFQAQALK